MAKGDYITVTSEIGGQLVATTVMVKTNGGDLDIDHDKRTGDIVVAVLNRTGYPTGERHTFRGPAIRSVEEHLSREK
jgi:hypothetical protein